MVVVIRQ